MLSCQVSLLLLHILTPQFKEYQYSSRPQRIQLLGQIFPKGKNNNWFPPWAQTKKTTCVQRHASFGKIHGIKADTNCAISNLLTYTQVWWISEWSSQLYSQLKQLRKLSLKKIQAWTGFEPMTSAIPVQSSTNWAIKPTGSWSFSEFYNLYTRIGDEMIVNIHIFWTAEEIMNKWVIIVVIYAT